MQGEEGGQASPRLDCQSACKKERKVRHILGGGIKILVSKVIEKNARSPCRRTDGVIDELFTGKKSTHRSKFRKIITDQKFGSSKKSPASRIPQSDGQLGSGWNMEFCLPHYSPCDSCHQPRLSSVENATRSRYCGVVYR